MTNKECVDLCIAMGFPVKSHSSSLGEAYADQVRRRAQREGLVRDVQPEEPKPVKKGAAKKAAATADAGATVETAPEPAPADEAPAPVPVAELADAPAEASAPVIDLAAAADAAPAPRKRHRLVHRSPAA